MKTKEALLKKVKLQLDEVLEDMESYDETDTSQPLYADVLFNRLSLILSQALDTMEESIREEYEKVENMGLSKKDMLRVAAQSSADQMKKYEQSVRQETLEEFEGLRRKIFSGGLITLDTSQKEAKWTDTLTQLKSKGKK